MVGGLVGKRRGVSLQEKEGCYMVMYFGTGRRKLPRLSRAGNVVYGCHTRRLVQSSLFAGISLPAYPVVK
jgi:hypothetical protein